MSIQNITIYGAGLIGSGWATHFLCSGITSIALYDLSQDALNTARRRVEDSLHFLAEEKVITHEQAQKLPTLIHCTTDRKEALAQADLIVENCPENLELKQSVMQDIESSCPVTALIASSTSGISATQIAAKMQHPERMLGAHPYHPVYLLPLVELVRGEKTAHETVTSLVSFLKATGKEPVVLKKESPGYIASRLMSVLFRESSHMINQGVCTMEDVETAFTYGPGLRYALTGINTTLQLAGGSHGLAGTLTSGIGSSGGSWLEACANFTQWPKEFEPFWHTCQQQMDDVLAHRDALHGRTNEEIELFRNRGLIKLLQYHGKLQAL